MGKTSTATLVQRAYALCSCGSCLTCGMANRLLGQVEEINNQARVRDAYLHMAVWRVGIIQSAVKHLKGNRPECALTSLTNRVADGDELLRELAEVNEGDSHG